MSNEADEDAEWERLSRKVASTRLEQSQENVKHLRYKACRKKYSIDQNMIESNQLPFGATVVEKLKLIKKLRAKLGKPLNYVQLQEIQAQFSLLFLDMCQMRSSKWSRRAEERLFSKVWEFQDLLFHRTFAIIDELRGEPQTVQSAAGQQQKGSVTRGRQPGSEYDSSSSSIGSARGSSSKAAQYAPQSSTTAVLRDVERSMLALSSELQPSEDGSEEPERMFAPAPSNSFRHFSDVNMGRLKNFERLSSALRQAMTTIRDQQQMISALKSDAHQAVDRSQT